MLHFDVIYFQTFGVFRLYVKNARFDDDNNSIAQGLQINRLKLAEIWSPVVRRFKHFWDEFCRPIQNLLVFFPTFLLSLQPEKIMWMRKNY